MSDIQRNIPKLRFPGFTSDWEQRKLGDTCKMNGRIGFRGYTEKDIISKEAGGVLTFSPTNIVENKLTIGVKNTYITRDKYEESPEIMVKNGNILFVKTGSTLGKSALVTGIEEDCTVNPQVVVIKVADDMQKILSVALTSVPVQKQITAVKIGGAVPTMTETELKNIDLVLPQSSDERIKIGEYFSNLDNLITLHQRKCDAIKEYKKGMLQKMFPREGEKTPEIRFPGFTDDWEQRKLEDMCTIITKQTGFDYSATIKPSLVTTKESDTYSFIQNKDFEGTNINLDTDFYIPISVAEKYPKITLDQPSLLISISGRIGNVGLYLLESKAFIGGAVGICKLKNIEDGKTALYELLSPAGQKYFNSLIKASSHANITIEDIRNIEILLPKDEDEKKKLNSYFDNLDNLITLHQRKCDKYKELKKGLLQQMFV